MEKMSRSHVEVKTQLSRLAMSMYENFNPIHDGAQSEEYNRLQMEYIQLQADEKEMDRFDPPVFKSMYNVG